MGVVAVWKCDRDGAMFETKKEAEEYDRMLELAANISDLLEKAIPELNESHSETIGLLLAKHRDVLAKACKGKPEALLEIDSDDESANDASEPEDEADAS